MGAARADRGRRPQREAELAADGARAALGVDARRGTDWALGIEARSRALLSDDEAAERLYREAIERLARTRIRASSSPAPISLYGEWLRRQSRRPDAREQLRTAHEMFAAHGRRRRSPSAPRASSRPPARPPASAPSRPATQLTAQEAQIARLARDGLSNPEIGARLFISPRTVEYHLHKVFGKLDIRSRTELGGALPADPRRRCRPSVRWTGRVSASVREPPRPGGRCCRRSRTRYPAPRSSPSADRARPASGCRSLDRTGRRVRRPSCRG